MKGHGRYFPDTRLTFQVREDVGWVVAPRIIVSSSFPLDFEFRIKKIIWYIFELNKQVLWLKKKVPL